MELKNLFELAPKELTQDGFIRWVIENYQHDDIKDLARRFILFLTTGFEKTPPIDIEKEASTLSHINTLTQVNHMDIVIDFFYKGHENYSDYVLIIEDKVGSKEHDNQLNKYNKVLESWSNPYEHKREIKVYYKTYPMDEEETKKVNDAGWRIIPFKDIVAFWKGYIEHPNIIVKFYAEHICKIGESAEMSAKPKDNDILAWKSFFDNKFKGLVEDHFPNAYVYTGVSRYGYAYLNVFKSGYKMNECPYLEIRSRDLLSEAFMARILRYGVDLTPESFDALRQAIALQKNAFFRANWGEKRDKQAGHTKESDSRLSALTEEAIAQSLLECAKEYLKIIEDWEAAR